MLSTGRRLLYAVVVTACVLLVGLAIFLSSPSLRVPSPSMARTPTTPVGIGESNNGQNFRLHRGDVVTLALSGYWQVTSTGPLVATGTPGLDTSGCEHAVPGSGCARVVQQYQAYKVGSGSVLASRDSCGEAMKCRSSQRHWRVNVDVVP